MAELSEELLEIAEKELNETADTRVSALSTFRKLISTWPKEECNFVADDNFLLAFLRPCKFDIKKAARKLKAMMKFRIQHADLIHGLNGESLRSFYEQGSIRYLNGKSRSGATIAAILPANLQDARTLLGWNIWSLDRLQFEPDVQVCGFVVIVNNQGFTLSKLFQLQKDVHYIVESRKFFLGCVPFRLKGIFILNAPSFMSWVWALIKPFLSKKLRERVHMLGSDLRKLHQAIDPKYLPAEFGGTLAAEGADSWYEQQMQREKAQQPSALTMHGQPYDAVASSSHAQHQPHHMPTHQSYDYSGRHGHGPAEVEMTETNSAGAVSAAIATAAAATAASTMLPAVISQTAGVKAELTSIQEGSTPGPAPSAPSGVVPDPTTSTPVPNNVAEHSVPVSSGDGDADTETGPLRLAPPPLAPAPVPAPNAVTARTAMPTTSPEQPPISDPALGVDALSEEEFTAVELSVTPAAAVIEPAPAATTEHAPSQDASSIPDIEAVEAELAQADAMEVVAVPPPAVTTAGAGSASTTTDPEDSAADSAPHAAAVTATPASVLGDAEEGLGNALGAVAAPPSSEPLQPAAPGEGSNGGDEDLDTNPEAPADVQGATPAPSSAAAKGGEVPAGTAVLAEMAAEPVPGSGSDAGLIEVDLQAASNDLEPPPPADDTPVTLGDSQAPDLGDGADDEEDAVETPAPFELAAPPTSVPSLGADASAAALPESLGEVAFDAAEAVDSATDAEVELGSTPPATAQSVLDATAALDGADSLEMSDSAPLPPSLPPQDLTPVTSHADEDGPSAKPDSPPAPGHDQPLAAATTAAATPPPAETLEDADITATPTPAEVPEDADITATPVADKDPAPAVASDSEPGSPAQPDSLLAPGSAQEDVLPAATGTTRPPPQPQPLDRLDSTSVPQPEGLVAMPVIPASPGADSYARLEAAGTWDAPVAATQATTPTAAQPAGTKSAGTNSTAPAPAATGGQGEGEDAFSSVDL